MIFKVYATYNIQEEAKKFNKELIIVDCIEDDWENYFEIEINSLEELIAFKDKANCEVILARDGKEIRLEIYNGYRE